MKVTLFKDGFIKFKIARLFCNRISFSEFNKFFKVFKFFNIFSVIILEAKVLEIL